jgi:hypothetical protein
LVLEPESLRDEIKAEAEEIVAEYQKTQEARRMKDSR